VLDGLDACANTPKGATVDAKGCPTDADGDGVWDGLDQCPDTPAGLKVDDKGCPTEVAGRETELLETGMVRIENVQFDEGQATIKAESYPSLDVVGLLLKSWPQLTIEIGGHTDSKGSSVANLKLSQARAEAVRTYLTGKFPTIDAKALTAKGYGKSKPVVPNTTDENRAKNRRVEFVVTNKAVLKQEIAKRAASAAPADSTQK
jgi:OOP family OmpA-OmpF porin